MPNWKCSLNHQGRKQRKGFYQKGLCHGLCERLIIEEITGNVGCCHKEKHFRGNDGPATVNGVSGV